MSIRKIPIGVVLCAAIVLLNNSVTAAEKDVNVINTPDVNVANTPDVSVVSTPSAEIGELRVLCAMNSGQPFNRRTCRVDLIVPSGKLLKIERIDGSVTPQAADLDKDFFWQVSLDERHAIHGEFDTSRPSGTSAVRSFGEEVTGYASFRIHVHIFSSSSPVLGVPAGVYVTYRLIDGNIENVDG